MDVFLKQLTDFQGFLQSRSFNEMLSNNWASFYNISFLDLMVVP